MAEDMGDDATNRSIRINLHSTLFPVVHRSERRWNDVTQEHKADALSTRGSIEDVEAGIGSRAPVTTVRGSRSMKGGFIKRRSSSEPPSLAIAVSPKQFAGKITPSRLEQRSRGGTELSAANPGVMSHCPTAAARGTSEGSRAIGEHVMPQAAASVRKEKEMAVPSVFPLSSVTDDVCEGSERGGGKSAANILRRSSTMMFPGTWTNRLAKPSHLRRTSSKMTEATDSEFKTPEELARLESVREEL